MQGQKYCSGCQRDASGEQIAIKAHVRPIIHHKNITPQVIMASARTSHVSISDPDSDSSGSEAQSLDGYDMFAHVDNPDEIVFPCPGSHDSDQASRDDIAPANLDSVCDEASVDDVDSGNKAEASLNNTFGLVRHLSC